jgi:biopolymer transport protein ExbB/TolQ
MLPDGKTILTALWAPALAGTLVTAVTWLVWYHTALPCTSENAVESKCHPSVMARYISTSILHHCVIHASIAITIIGGSDLMLFLRERHRNNQMMDIMKTFLDEAIEQRRQEVEQRREEAEQRRQEAEQRRQETELRQQEAQARREADARAAEERQQAAAERQAFLEALNRLTEAIGQNGRDRQ